MPRFPSFWRFRSARSPSSIPRRTLNSRARERATTGDRQSSCGAKILAGGFSEGHSKRRNESADTVVADIHRDRGDCVAAGQQPERVTQLELLAPFAEPEARFQLEDAL